MQNILNLVNHGANPEKIYKLFNIKIPERIIDFSSNTNIIPFPEDFNEYIRSKNHLFNLISNYPDYECLRLRKFISERENLSIKNILFTNGINEAIFLLSRVLTGRTAIFQPNYTEYKRAFLNSEDIFDLNNSGDFNNIIISNPCNPTGIFINNLYEISGNFKNTNFIIDESYMDFLINSEREILKFKNLKNIIILRSLTKIFHLSGLRIGYVIADENIIENLKKFQPSWSVNSIAQDLALKFLNDKNFYSRTQNFYKKNVPEFINLLKDSGFNLSDTSVHYFLIQVKNDIEIIKNLLKLGIVVRHTRNFPGLQGNYLRIASRFPKENILLLNALKNLK